MKTIGPDKTYIDYLQSVCPLIEGLPRFGIRVRRDRFILVKVGNGLAEPCGRDYPFPVKIEDLPSHVRVIVEDDLLSYPSSDLFEVLAGEKSFLETLDSSPENTTTANRRTRLAYSS